MDFEGKSWIYPVITLVWSVRVPACDLRLVCSQDSMSQENVYISSMNAAPQLSQPGQLRLQIRPSTGGSEELLVSPTETVQGLKSIVSKKYKIPSNKISLLFKDR